MMISYKPQTGFPFGNNIHVIYSINSQKFIFVHPALDWIVSDGEGNEVQAALSKIEKEDILFLQEIFNGILSNKFTGKIIFKLISRRGVHWFQAIPFLADYKGDEVIVSTIIDVSDEITNMHSISKFADKKNSILNMLGHDLRGPLNVAKSVLKAVDGQANDPTILKKTGYVAKILQQSIDLINNLVSREALEITNNALVKKRVNIVGRLADYLEECRRSDELSGISFHLKSSSDKIYISLDEPKFMQVTNNLISNSLKFTPAGGTINIVIAEQQDEVHFIFSDNGIGMPQALLPKLFDKFTPAGRPGLQGEPTLGLGLYIVKTIIGWHAGHIRCESSEGNGTTFFIKLPKAHAY